jgi:thioredoxin 1
MTSEKVHELNELNFESMVLDRRGTVLVDFTAEWCSPCKALAPVIERFAEKTWGQVVVGSVDADVSPDLSARFRIHGLPTLIVFRDGHEAARRTGLTNDAGVAALLDSAMSREGRCAGT